MLGLVQPGDLRARLRHALQTRFPTRRLSFHASGREAMRFAAHRLAQQSGRDEIAVPAYCCFSIPASVVAAGLRVRLIDVDERGRVVPEALARQPLERVAAVVIGNLFGLPEPATPIGEIAHAAGAAVIDDAAQALGATEGEFAAGDRGDVGVLSFGRGKPLSALGGGVSIWRGAPPASSAPAVVSTEGMDAPRRIAALVRALAYDLARHPRVLGLLTAIPSLGIGRTVYDPHFAGGSMTGAAVALAASLVPLLDEQNGLRRTAAHTLADAISSRTAFTPLLEAPGTTGVYPRLGVVAPSPDRRNRALAVLARFGATALYPSPLASIRALQPHLAESAPCRGAEDFCHRLLTLPTHAAAVPARADEIVSFLADC